MSMLQLSGGKKKKGKEKKIPRFLPNNICVLGIAVELI